MARLTLKQKKLLEESKIEITAFQKMYDGYTDKFCDEAIKVKGKIAILMDQVQELEELARKHDELEEKRKIKQNWESESAAIESIVDHYDLAYIIPNDELVYCDDFGIDQSNPKFINCGGSRIITTLEALTDMDIKSTDTMGVIRHLRKIGRTYQSAVSSFNNNKWNGKKVYNRLGVIRKRWVQPNYEEHSLYNKDFDLLMYAVGGGKQENIDHLEQWIAFKYLHPHKSANTPNIDLGGRPGGNGKGRLTELMKTIFTTYCVITAHKNELVAQFNAAWAAANILVYDEPEESELPSSKLKQATGNEDLRIERKGVDSEMADRNFNFLFISNNANGVVKLSGGGDGGEDRRWSVISTNIVLYDVLIEAGMTDAEARQWLDRFAQETVKDRAQVARWLAHIIIKHNVQDMTILPALHGEDYHARFEDQKDSITEAFDRIMPVFDSHGFIPQTILGDLVRVLTDNINHKDKNVLEKFEDYLKRNKIETQTLERQWVTISGVKSLSGEPDVRVQGKIIKKMNSPLSNEFEFSTICSQKFMKSTELSPMYSNLNTGNILI